VLDTYRIDVGDVKKVSRPEIRRQVLFCDFETHLGGVIVPGGKIVHWNYQALQMGKCRSYGASQVVRECGNAALSRQIITEKGNLADLKRLFQELQSSSAFVQKPKD
jgi:hypothetical protein